MKFTYRFLCICALFFAAVAVVNAQSVPASNEPSSTPPDPDVVNSVITGGGFTKVEPKPESDEDDLLFINSQNYDHNKAAGLLNPAPDPNNPQNDSEMAVIEANEEQLDRGYANIPGFTYTGNEAVDEANYAQALEDLKKTDLPLYLQLTNQ